MHKIKSLSFLFYIALLSSCIISLTNAQDYKLIKGSWAGKLQIQTVELRIVFNVKQDEDGKLFATMDSPDQGAYGITVDEVKFNGADVEFNLPSITGYFKGIFIEDSLLIRGDWNQGGMSLPLVLKWADKIEKPKRPQEPQKLFPYLVEEVKFHNARVNVTLAGTLTIPDTVGTFPAVILISGSGPQNRDEELLGHKPFLVLSDYLTRNGIAVLRYDDRGVGESTGNFESATTVDFAEDALAAIQYLKNRKEINTNLLGVIGHSEGGLIAPMLAIKSDDVKFIILLAGPGLRGDKILLHQSELIQEANNVNESEIKKGLELSRKIYDVLLSETDSLKASNKLTEILEQQYSEFNESEEESTGDKQKIIENKLEILLNPWFIYFVNYDPYPTLTKIKIPVLALNGEKDLQVPAKDNLNEIEKALNEAGNKSFKIIELPGLNHLFQKCETGSPLEYGRIEETFSPEAMKIIIDWINVLNIEQN